MEEALHRIEPGQGIGNVKFGDSTEQVQKYLGSPDVTDNLDQSTTLWNYRSLRLEIAFQSADWPSAAMNKYVVQFMTRHPATMLWGKQIIGRHENEVLDIFRENGCRSFAVSDEVVGPFNYRTFRLEQLHVVLDFRDGLLRGVLWGESESRWAESHTRQT